MNKIRVEKDSNGKAEIFLNGEKLDGVLDYKILKNSAQERTEFYIIFDVAELIEHIKE